MINKKLLRRIILAFAVASVLSACAINFNTSPEYLSKPGTITTIMLTRHADRDAMSGMLNEKGRARAEALAREIGEMNITAIYVPDLLRNKETARPLAKQLGLEITVAGDPPDIELVIETMLNQHAGEIVLWVGNTNNLPQIYSKLSGQGEAPNRYGDLFIMKVKDQGLPDVIKKHYGAKN